MPRKTSTKATEETKVVAEKTQEPIIEKAEEKKIVLKDIDPNTIVTVQNGSNGKLIYISPRTQERYVWEEFGDEQEMELRELRNAKSANKKFYEKNWFMFNEDNEWVIQYLGVSQYYKNSIRIDELDSLFDKDANEIVSIISKLSPGQKRTVSYMARQAIADGEIDSRKLISSLEEVLGVDLIEK